MKMYTLWGTRKAFPNTPELMVALDENRTANNKTLFRDECERAKKSWGADLYEFRSIVITIPEGVVERSFYATRINLCNG